jgi:predicted AAA+ superfamily ATPase
VEEIFPLKFVEYLLLRNNIFPQKGLSQEIKNAFFFSETAKEAYLKLQNLEKQVFAAWSKIPESEITKKRYFEVGVFPFALDIASSTLAMDRIKDMLLVNIAQKDLISLGDFDAETLVKIPDLLYLLAASDEITTGKISDALKINERTLSKALDALLRAEIIFEVLPYGRPYSQIKKSSKYLFIGSSIRISLLGAIIPAGLAGKPLEDYVALVFAKELSKDAQFFYDYSSGGADFIVRFKDKKEIVMEVGFGKEETRQVIDSLKKTDGRGKYGMVIGSGKLELVNESILKIPLEYFLLI